MPPEVTPWFWDEGPAAGGAAEVARIRDLANLVRDFVAEAGANPLLAVQHARDAGYTDGEIAQLWNSLDELGAYVDMGGGGTVPLADAQSAYTSVRQALELAKPSTRATPVEAGKVWDFVRAGGDLRGNAVNPAEFAPGYAEDLVAASESLGMVPEAGALGASGLVEGAGIALESVLPPAALIVGGIIAFKLATGYYLRWVFPALPVPTSADVGFQTGGAIFVPGHGWAVPLVPYYHGSSGQQFAASDGYVTFEADCTDFHAALDAAAPATNNNLSCNGLGSIPDTAAETATMDAQLGQWFGDSAAVPGSWGQTGPVHPTDAPAFIGQQDGTTMRTYRRLIPAGRTSTDSISNPSTAGASGPTLMPPTYDPAAEGAIVIQPHPTTPLVPRTANPVTIESAIPPTLRPLIDVANDPLHCSINPVTHFSSCDAATGPDAPAGPVEWTMPDCGHEDWTVCYGDIVTAAPSTIQIVLKPAPTHVDTYPDGAVVTTDPGAGVTTRKIVYIEVNDPSAPADPNPQPQPITLPQPEANETYTAYVTRLRALGWLGTVERVELTDASSDNMTGPNGVVRLTAPIGLITPVLTTLSRVAWPLPLPVITPNVPITLVTNPPSAAPAPGPGPPPGGGPPAPPSGGTCNCPPIDFSPLLVGTTHKFPFGVFPWIKSLFDSFASTSERPTWNITKPAALGGGVWTITMPTYDATYRNITDSIVKFILVVGSMWFAGTWLVGWGRGDSVAE